MSMFRYRPDRGRDFMFVHIAKSGGSAVRRGYLKDTPAKKKLVFKGSEDWPWDRSFMFLRDPRERFLSGWGERAPNAPLEELLRILKDDSIGCNPPGAPGSGPVDTRHHMLPICHRLNRKMFLKVLDRGSWVRTEHSEEGWPLITEWLGLPPDTLKRIRVGTRRRAWTDLSADDRSRIDKFLEEDYAMLADLAGPYGGQIAQLES